MMASRFLAAVLAGGILALGGCSSVIPGVDAPAPRIYDLTPKSTYPEDLPTVDWQLVVERPTAASSLNTPRIAVRHSLTRLDYFERAVWSDSAPALVQTRLIESFENSDRIVAIGRESMDLRSDYVLKLELREFYADLREDPTTADVHLIARLVRMPEREIVDWTSESYEMAADGDSMVDIVAAFDEALGKAMKRVVIWTIETGEKHAR